MSASEPPVAIASATPTNEIPRPPIRRLAFLREAMNTLAFFIAVFTFLQLTLPRSVVLGSSMEPNFEEGQYLVVSRVNYLLGDPQRGDIVVFNSPEASENEPSLIKRVIGLPGDVIEFRDSQLYINGEWTPEPYIKEPCRNCRDNLWILGEGEYFLMGDNRNVSNDSRAFGIVTHDRIIGEVVFRYWPLNKFGVAHQYHYR